MRGDTHIIGGVATGMALVAGNMTGTISLLPPNDPLSYLTVATACIIGSLLPDIDIPNSKAGRKVRWLSTAINESVGHRTFFHSPVFLLTIVGLFLLLAPKYLWVGVSLALGGVSHLLLDMLNESGIPLFWPNKKRFSIAAIRLGGIGEMAVKGCLLLLIVFLCQVINQNI